MWGVLLEEDEWEEFCLFDEFLGLFIEDLLEDGLDDDCFFDFDDEFDLEDFEDFVFDIFFFEECLFFCIELFDDFLLWFEVLLLDLDFLVCFVFLLDFFFEFDKVFFVLFNLLLLLLWFIIGISKFLNILIFVIIEGFDEFFFLLFIVFILFFFDLDIIFFLFLLNIFNFLLSFLFLLLDIGIFCFFLVFLVGWWKLGVVGLYVNDFFMVRGWEGLSKFVVEKLFCGSYFCLFLLFKMLVLYFGGLGFSWLIGVGLYLGKFLVFGVYVCFLIFLIIGLSVYLFIFWIGFGMFNFGFRDFKDFLFVGL